jgi:serine phosphatase RsbU (regulator of sigma subunit)
MIAMVAFVLAINLELLRTRQTALLLTNEVVPTIDQVGNLAKHEQLHEDAITGFLLTGRGEYDRERIGELDERRKAIATIVISSSSSGLQSQAIHLQIESREAAREEVRLDHLVLEGHRREAKALYYRTVHPMNDEINRDTALLLAKTHAGLDKQAHKLKRRINNLVIAIWGALILALIFSLAFILTTAGWIFFPARRIAWAAEAVAQGDYSPAISLGKRKDHGAAELTRIAVAMSNMARSLEEHERTWKQGYEHQRIIAETLQKSFLPTINHETHGYRIADIYAPAQHDSHVGGDYYDVIHLDDKKLGIVMADVSGKGVDAAVYTAMSKYMLRGFARENCVPDSVMMRLNDALTYFTAGEVFVTLFFGVLDTAKRTLVYSNGGHEYPMLFRADTGGAEILESTGTALGIVHGARYGVHEVSFARGDVLVLYTDGITEARAGKEFFGVDRLAQLVTSLGCLSAKDIANGIMMAIETFTTDKIRDDIAILVIEAKA